jgi:hypothetical protein
MFLGLSFLVVATMLEDTDEILLMESVDIPESQTDLRTSKKRPPPRGPSLVIFNQANKIKKLDEEKIELQEENKHLQEDNSKDKQYIRQLEYQINHEDLIIAQLKEALIKVRKSSSSVTTGEVSLVEAKKLAYSLGMQAGQGLFSDAKRDSQLTRKGGLDFDKLLNFDEETYIQSILNENSLIIDSFIQGAVVINYISD